VGSFPPGWTEWNDKYRDNVRRFWRGDRGQVPELASRLSGSADLYQPSDRRPHASVNFITAHDGFTLQDLVSYEEKHNEANGDENHDGTDNNLSSNWGLEGPTESLPVVRMRERIKRNFMATLAFSQGVPMISHGDELGRTQEGNNNAYCQDNELAWVDWNLDPWQRKFFEFTARLFAIRRENPVFRRRTFFRGRPANGVRDIAWLRPDGEEMAQRDWEDPGSHVLGILLFGHAADQIDERGRPIRGDSLLLLLNGGGRSRLFRLPRMQQAGGWKELLNTARPGTRSLRGEVNLVAHSLILLHHASP
jgi:glycogen operon protein